MDGRTRKTILRLFAGGKGLSQIAIARQLRISPSTVNTVVLSARFPPPAPSDLAAGHKLPEIKQLAIRHMWNGGRGLSQRAIARRMGISTSTVNAVVTQQSKFQFRFVKKKHRCPVCRYWILTDKCLICAARNIHDRQLATESKRPREQDECP